MLKVLSGWCTAAVGAIALAVSPATAENFPDHPIHILTSEVGGSNDIIARFIAAGAQGPLGQPIIIENRGSEVVGPLGKRATPDGYTLVLSSSSFILGPLLKKEAYDPVKDFVPITIATQAPNVLIVHPSLPVHSVQELIDYAKARPGKLNYASAGVGSAADLGAAMFNDMAHVDIVRINYRGTGPAMNAILSNEVQVMVATGGSLMPNLEAGRVRGLAVTTLQPSDLFPDLPTVAATVPDYETTIMGGVWAPAGTPKPIIVRLNKAFVAALDPPEVKNKLRGLGVVTGGNSPEEFDAMIKAQISRMSKVIKSLGISDNL